MFLDEVEILVRAGDGGRGAVSFRREKFVPRGGPDGGDGGNGGDVALLVDPNLNTLAHLIHRRNWRAENGGGGRGGRCSGRRGRPCVVRVPPGTVVKDRALGVTLKDLTRPGERFVAARGGAGGRGNARFATPIVQAPRHAEPGRPGERRRLLLELKLLADVGLLGLPNAGKSTLLRAISAAKPRVSPHPFTTLHPHLGIVEDPSGAKTPLVVADLPGLIEGAHRGVGLGIRFLRHVERTRLLVHIVDLVPPAGPSPEDAYRVVRAELEAYSPELASRPEIVVGNKIDLPGAPAALRRLRASLGVPAIGLSGLTSKGVPDLVCALFRPPETGFASS
jgi:GTP-binding protein